MTTNDSHAVNGICPSPSGEARWGLMPVCVRIFAQLCLISDEEPLRRQVIAMKSEQEFFVFGATAGEAIFLRLLLGK